MSGGALEELYDVCEQHIGKLLKEREQLRAEVARLSAELSEKHDHMVELASSNRQLRADLLRAKETLARVADRPPLRVVKPPAKGGKS
jgi:predicted nuclease with TOPRIM domain